MTAEPVNVQIMGQSLSVTSDESEEHVRQVAAEVDRRMRQVANDGRITSSLTVAVITALNIASEYHKLRQQQDQVQEIIERLTTRVAEQARTSLKGEHSRNG